MGPSSPWSPVPTTGDSELFELGPQQVGWDTSRWGLDPFGRGHAGCLIGGSRERRGLSGWLPPKLASGCRGAFSGPGGRPSPGVREYTGFEMREFREARGTPGLEGWLGR